VKLAGNGTAGDALAVRGGAADYFDGEE